MCRELSFVSASAWALCDRTTSLLEGAHADINLEGKNLSLLAAVDRGRKFDLRRTQSFNTLANSGITSRYIRLTDEVRYCKKIKRSGVSLTRS